MAGYNLTEDELDCGFRAICWHGYSTLIPTPKEWDAVVASWDTIRAELARIDLYNYQPFDSLRVYAPKNQGNVRATTLLHPQDLIIYTSLVHLLKRDIEKGRLSKSKRRVFSYRASKKAGVIYDRKDAYQHYSEALIDKATITKNRVVATADISDFYPRIYQHRLENILESLTKAGSRERSAVRILLKKLLPAMSGGASYGIPVGPLASRLLGEATLIDVDDYLDNQRYDFIRWVDDFSFFCNSTEAAQTLLYSFGKWLFEHHGLTLSTAKTKIYPDFDYISAVQHKMDGYVDGSASRVIQQFIKMKVAYEDETDDWDDTIDEFDDLADEKITVVFENAIKSKDAINYELASALLMRFAKIRTLSTELRLAALDVVMRNLDALFPIMDSVSRFIQSIDLEELSGLKTMGNRLLRPVNVKNIEAYEFYLMWVLDIFASSPLWKMDKKISQIKAKASNQVIKRYCDLALAVSGKRSTAVDAKGEIASAAPLRRLSLLYLSRNWGEDERKHWRKGKRFSSIMDECVFDY